MFEFDWAGRKRVAPASPVARGAIAIEGARRVAPLLWEEHCTECAIPECYTSCPLYVRRSDDACARFAAGIEPSAGGLIGPGGTVTFRQWGKLTSAVPAGLTSARIVWLAALLDRRLGAALRAAAGRISDQKNRRRALNAYSARRRAYLTKLGGRRGPVEGRLFVGRVFNHERRSVPLIFEHSHGSLEQSHHSRAVYRHSWTLEPGLNEISLPDSAPAFHAGPHAYVHIYPEVPGVTLTFHVLDFVELRRAAANGRPSGSAGAAASTSNGRAQPNGYVKCVAWDLDETLWRGILAEADGRAPELRAQAKQLIELLDQRGIVQTVVSRNNYTDAWEHLQALELDQFFLFPSISWDPKSEQLKRVASDLNIGLDAILLVDDSPFERAEVSAALPEVRVADGADLEALERRPDLSPPVSAEARQRRRRYSEEAVRRNAAVEYDDYKRFLSDCRIVAELFVPDGEQVHRCVELVQRSNQLNLSGRCLSEPDFKARDRGEIFLAGRCRDRFGDYGTVVVLGLAAAEDALRITDLCVSCRVAGRYVEHAIVQWIAANAGEWCRAVCADIFLTAKNEPLRAVIDDIGFAVEPSGDHRLAAELRLPARIPGADLVAVIGDGALLPGPRTELLGARDDRWPRD
jgi:FkbH-like protein